jgi:hypothetical protein
MPPPFGKPPLPGQPLVRAEGSDTKPPPRPVMPPPIAAPAPEPKGPPLEWRVPIDARSVPEAPAPAIDSAPATNPDAAPAGPVPACPNCDGPTDWNDEHLRFYCRKCRLYM